MKTNELLERRAQRGTAQGAANVWGSVQLDAHRQTNSQSAWMSRVALLVWTVAVGTVGFFAVTEGGVAETAPAQQEGAPIVSSEPLPESLLVEGMELVRVARPFNSDFDGDDVLDDPAIVNGHSENFPLQDPPFTTVVFADPSDPFKNPVVGLDLIDGGFRPWSANVDRKELDGFVDQLVRDGGEWTMPAGSGLVEVAKFTSDHSDFLMYGWQFDFKDGKDEVILQAETAEDPSSANEWLWVARSVRDRGVDAVITEVEVLGQTGLRLAVNDESVDQVVWAADGFVYRMTASTLDGDTYTPRQASSEISTVQKSDRASWVAAINAANRQPKSAGIVVILAALILVGLAISLTLFAIKGEYKTAAALAVLIAIVLATGIGFLSSATPIGLLLIGLVGLGLILWQSQRRLWSSP